MKIREKENLKKKNLEDLQKLLRDKKEKKFDLLFKHNATPISNPLQIRELRKEIALIKTLISQKEKQETAKAESKK